MEVIYATEKLKIQCTSHREAKKLFGGNDSLAVSLLARINALVVADNLKDIILQPTFHFRNLKNKKGRDLESYFAIDVKSRKEKWRIILQPLNERQESYNPCNIDQIASKVKIVEVSEVSKHYE